MESKDIIIIFGVFIAMIMAVLDIWFGGFSEVLSEAQRFFVTSIFAIGISFIMLIIYSNNSFVRKKQK